MTTTTSARTASTAPTAPASTAAGCTSAQRGARSLHRAPAVRLRRPVHVPLVETAVDARPVVRTTRLTRRGRLVVLVALVGLLLAAFSFGRADAPRAATETEAAPAVVQTTVQPGDSLWSVARRVAPQSDPREVVEQLRRLNDLSGSGLQAGQQLLLPV